MWVKTLRQTFVHVLLNFFCKKRRWKNFKIDEYLANICTKVWLMFLTHGVVKYRYILFHAVRYQPFVQCASCDISLGSERNRTGQSWCRTRCIWNRDRRCSREIAISRTVPRRVASTCLTTDILYRTASRWNQWAGRWLLVKQWNSWTAAGSSVPGWTTESRPGCR